MMKHLWLYPLIYALMIIAIIACMLHIGSAICEMRQNRIYTNAQLVWEVKNYASA